MYAYHRPKKVIQVAVFLLVSLLYAQWLIADDTQQSLQQLFDEEWQYRLNASPTLATWVGETKFNDRLDNVSEKAQKERFEYWSSILNRVDAIAIDALSEEEQVNLSIFRRQIQSFLSQYRFKAYMIPLSSDEGFHTALARLPQYMPFNSEQDYQNYLSRLAVMAEYLDEHRALMRGGLEIGMTLPKVVLKGRSQAFRVQIVERVEDSVFYQPFIDEKAPIYIKSEDWVKWRKQASAYIMNEIVPAYKAFTDFFEQDYIQRARQTIAARELPNGEAYYQDQVKYYTTLDISPDEIHDIGLKEVARIRAEMDAIIAELGFAGDFADFLAFLRKDEQFYAESAEALLMRAAWIAKRADAALPKLFNQLPRQPYGVAPVPDEIAPYYTGGRYIPAPGDGRGAAYYWVNTYQLNSRPLYVLPALTLHEAVPGHHLQNALAAESGEQPEFRRNDYISAYGEGWGLYSEYLGIEMGIYQTPYEHFGRLTYEMWRACRLVVDTGMHWKGWSRQRALDYLAGNTALSLHEVETEIDRYIAWPAQALSYKMGELTIKRLRNEAEQALGARFDLAAFHDLILSLGSVPLPILEQKVNRYIQTAASAESSS